MSLNSVLRLNFLECLVALLRLLVQSAYQGLTTVLVSNVTGHNKKLKTGFYLFNKWRQS